MIASWQYYGVEYKIAMELELSRDSYERDCTSYADPNVFENMFNMSLNMFLMRDK